MTGLSPRFETSRQVRQRFGNISEITLWRWENNSSLGFPKPIKINNRKFYAADALDAWQRLKASQERQINTTLAHDGVNRHDR